MRPELRDRFIEQLDAAFRWAGASGFDDGTREAKRIVSVLLQHIEAVQSRDDLIRLLDPLPDPGFAEEKFILGSMRFVPQLMRYGIKQLAQQVEEQIPAPRTGRPGVPYQEKARVVAYIGELHTRGASLEAGKKRAAQRFGYSESTVERMWLDRSTIGEVDFRSALKWVTDSIAAER